MRSVVLLAALLALSYSVAQAGDFTPYAIPRTAYGQNLSPPAGPPQGTDVVELARPTSNGIGIGYNLPLSAFASSADVQSFAAATAAHFTDLQSLATATAARLQQVNRRALQGVALSSAVTIVPPNPGDRLSLTLGSSNFASTVAGAGSVTYRPSDRVLVYGAYGRAASQDLIKGGVSFSFR